jgi:hypothetical protein
VFTYACTLGGTAAVWDKTEHDMHPAAPGLIGAARS